MHAVHQTMWMILEHLTGNNFQSSTFETTQNCSFLLIGMMEGQLTLKDPFKINIQLIGKYLLCIWHWTKLFPHLLSFEFHRKSEAGVTMISSPDIKIETLRDQKTCLRGGKYWVVNWDYNPSEWTNIMLLNIKLYQVLIQYGCGEDPLEVLWKYIVHLKCKFSFCINHKEHKLGIRPIKEQLRLCLKSYCSLANRLNINFRFLLSFEND